MLLVALPMPDSSKVLGQMKYSRWSSGFGVGCGTNDPTLGKFTDPHKITEWECSMDRIDDKFIQSFN
jgi:hypothetical protein